MNRHEYLPSLTPSLLLSASLCVLLQFAVNVLPRNIKGTSAKQRGKGSCPRLGRGRWQRWREWEPGRAGASGQAGACWRGAQDGPGQRPGADLRAAGAPRTTPTAPAPAPANPRPSSAPPLARGPRLRLRSPKDETAPGFRSAGRPKGTDPRASRSLGVPTPQGCECAPDS